MLKVSDPFVIMDANRLGYDILSDSDRNAWYRKNNRLVGPFKTLEEAALSAINEDYVRKAEELLQNVEGNE